MDRIKNSKYIKPNMSKQWLISNSFRYNTRLSDAETEIYTYRFSVYKYEKFTTLECELSVILGKDEVRINVYDYGTLDRYAPFYYCEYGNFDRMLEVIWSNINKQLNILGITSDKDNNENKESVNGSKDKEVKRKRNNPNKRE